MSHLVQTRLINDPFGDPGLFIDFRFGRRAIVFDAGDLTRLSSRELLRISHVLVSHRHMDHFAGLDLLLRLALYRPGVLNVIGPPGITEGVCSKLRAYTWNLLDERSVAFAIMTAEFAGSELNASTVFRARNAFRPERLDRPPGPCGLVLDESDLRIECAVLDHGTPCLAFALQESLRVNVWKEGLAAMGLAVGPWLNAAKSAVRRGAGDELEIDTGQGRTVPLGELRRRAFRVGPGQRIAYVTDAAFTPENARRIVELARGADHFYIEAGFLAEDAEIAAARLHLTAAQAGDLARRAGARRLTTFHYSPRYLDRPESLRLEAERAFKGPHGAPIDDEPLP